MPLYDANFVRTIPNEQQQERRPLVNLKAVYPWILENLSQWYDELLPLGDPDLYARLRDFEDSRNFIGAFWELVIYRYLRETGHDVLYNVAVNGGTPDFYWPRHDLIADVVAISDPHYGDAARAHIDQLTAMINQENLPFDLFISEFWFNEALNPRLTAIVSWLQRLGDLPSQELYDRAREYKDCDARIEVLIHPRSEGARVKAVGMFSLDAAQQDKLVKERLRRKLKKYQAPLMVFIGQGLGFWTVGRKTLNMSLYGNRLIHLSRIPGQTASGPDTAANGVFYNRMGRDGGPANTNLSAVVLATHSIVDNRFSVWLGAFHNPEAVRPLPRAFLSPMSQFLITSNNVAECGLEWVDDNEGVILGNPLPGRENRIDTGLSH